MKKIFITVFAVFAACMSMTANNDVEVKEENESTTLNSTLSTSQEDGNFSFSPAMFSYRSFDGFSDYGLYIGSYTPNGIGFTLGLHSDLENHGYYATDFVINYSIGILQQNDVQLLVNLGAGPVIRTHDELNGYTSHGDPKYKDKTDFDAIFNGDLMLKYKKFVLGAGYTLWAPKFKFGKDYKADGFHLTLGYCFKI